MAVFKCKICGGSLDIADGSSIAVCDYCGTKQTVPTTKDDVVANLFNRANNLRLKCEFDKAEQVYEKILDIDNTDSEAHWGMVLCKYGIEYVEDKKTDSKIPTCHRTLYEAILTDVDYLATIENADVAQKELYEAEALVIDGLQKNILNIVNNEESFDVFICYKETDEAGKRTIDSSIANDIYYQLTGEGFKVFYAPITLENKLGYEYEPYIFAALNSAKVMLVVGTKPEHFDAVWVRNEWSRFLKLIKSERSKLLIPCYKDMDAYELPDEFAHLQAQDMSKIGFIQDLLRGITKLVSSSKTQPATVKEAVINTADSNITPLLKRVFIFLEDEDWNNAEEYCEKVLDIDPECADAYVGKLMFELKVRTRNDLKNCKEPFENSTNYQKVIRFADNALASELKGYISFIKDRNAKKAKEEYNDSIYLRASEEYKSSDIEKLNDAIKLFTQIIEWKDSKELMGKCQAKIEQRILEEERQKELDRIAREKAKKRNKIIVAILTPVMIAIIVFAVIFNTVIMPNSKYNNAVALYESGKYQESIVLFSEIEDYKDSPQQKLNAENAIKEEKYNLAIEQYNSGEYQEAIALFSEIGNFKDSKNLLKEAMGFLRNHYKTFENIICAGYEVTLGIKPNGRVVAVGNNDYGQCDVSNWTDIVAVSGNGLVTYGTTTIGLKSNGRVVAVGNNDYGQCNVSNWTDIVAVSNTDGHTVGLKSDGRVVAVGNNDYGQCNVSNWTDIVAISANMSFTVGLKSDGTVVATGSKSSKVSDWSDIVAISTGFYHILGLKSDGTVVAVGYNYSEQCNVSKWSDIVAISAGGTHSLGLKSDGTVVAVGNNAVGQCNVSTWSEIVAVSAGSSHTLGLKSDGTVVAVGDNAYGQCNVSDWDLIDD